jgi:outer membrane biosynthesis protein TonB/ABC-type transport system involved in cytochrome c biogenesis permease component
MVALFVTSVRLHLRNKMALIYSYLFPTIFLVAFWVLYRYEPVPLVRHMGELLTVTALGGACFGLPTTMVSERERGVWRRYRLTPVRTASLVGGTVLARYVLLIVAGLLQLGLAMAIGMPMPKHPGALFVAFTCVAFAFIGLGLVIAMMADNVPAVQALGQCIFLPMLIIGGVAVPLSSLPDWAQRVSAFFPGRYAVEALSACVIGDGLPVARFSALALILIGAAGCLAGAKMFRWDAQQRFAAASSKGWVFVALAAWVAVGVTAESRGVTRARTTTTNQTVAPPAASPSVAPPVVAPPVVTPQPQPETAPPPKEEPPPTPKPTPSAVTNEPAPIPKRTPAPSPSVTPPAPGNGSDLPVPGPPPEPPRASANAPATWRAVTMADIDRDLIFSRLPPDAGIVTPIARADDLPDQDAALQLEQIRQALPNWKPGKVEDPIQRVRNFLFVPAVVDVYQMEGLEQFLPQIVFERLQTDIPKDDLIKILYWIALHPFDGDDSAVDDLKSLGLGNGPNDMQTTRDRVAVYAVKLLGRLTGKITPQ